MSSKYFELKATADDWSYIYIHQINESEFPKLEQRLSWELRGLTAVSMEYVFGPKIEKPENQRFYRPVTIKLPLPSISLDHVTEDGDVMRPEMIVMRFDEQDGGWRMNESRLKFDRATVSFETYNFAKSVDDYDILL